MDEENRTGSTTLSRALAMQLQRLGALRADLPRTASETMPVVPPKPAAIAMPPASPEDIVAQLLALEVIFPSQSLSREQMTLKYRLYCEDLKTIPQTVLARACERYRRDPASRFFPTPGQILALCRKA